MNFSLLAKLGLDSKAYQKGLDQSKKSTASFGKSVMSTFAKVGLAVGGVALVKDMINLGAAAVETGSKFEIVLGKGAKEAEARLQELREHIPETTASLKDATAVFANMAMAMGMSQDEAGKFALQMVELGGDLSAFHDATPEQMFLKLRAAIAGSSEPMRALGVDVRKTKLENDALTLGIIEQGEELDGAAFAHTVLASVVSQSSNAIGNAALTSHELATQMKMMNANVAEAKTRFGLMLLPAINEIATAFNKFAVFVEDNHKQISELVKTVFNFTKMLVIGKVTLQVFSAAMIAGKSVTVAFTVATRAASIASKAMATGMSIQAAIMKAYTFAAKAATIQTRIFRGVLASTGIGLIAVAVGMAVEQLGKFIGKFKEAQDVGSIDVGVNVGDLDLNDAESQITSLEGSLTSLGGVELTGLKTQFDDLKINVTGVDDAAKSLGVSTEAIDKLTFDAIMARAQEFDGSIVALFTHLQAVKNEVEDTDTGDNFMESLAQDAQEGSRISGMLHDTLTDIKATGGEITVDALRDGLVNSLENAENVELSLTDIAAQRFNNPMSDLSLMATSLENVKEKADRTDSSLDSVAGSRSVGLDAGQFLSEASRARTSANSLDDALDSVGTTSLVGTAQQLRDLEENADEAASAVFDLTQRTGELASKRLQTVNSELSELGNRAEEIEQDIADTKQEILDLNMANLSDLLARFGVTYDAVAEEFERQMKNSNSEIGVDVKQKLQQAIHEVRNDLRDEGLFPDDVGGMPSDAELNHIIDLLRTVNAQSAALYEAPETVQDLTNKLKSLNEELLNVKNAALDLESEKVQLINVLEEVTTEMAKIPETIQTSFDGITIDINELFRNIPGFDEGFFGKLDTINTTLVETNRTLEGKFVNQ